MSSDKPKFLAILGYPLEHTLSPVMQQAALDYCKLPWYYIPLEINPDKLGPALKGLRAVENFAGANVTVPHKEAVIPYLDALSPEAQAVGAVNTIVVEAKGWKGYNTDIEGFLAPLKRRRFILKGKNAVVLGAGGAARAVLYALIKEGAPEITIICRQPRKGQKMVEELMNAVTCRGVACYAPTFEILNFDDHTVADKINTAHLLVNATPLGMGTKTVEAQNFVPLQSLHAKTLVYDLIYNPPLTPLLKLARKKGAKILNGQDMLAAQGARAFELWTGKRAPRWLMTEVLTKALKRQ